MIWLFKKIFGLGVLLALAFFALNFPVGGRPLKDYAVDLWKAPLFQEAFRQAKGAVQGYLEKDVGQKESGPALDDLSDKDREELEEVLKKEAH